MDYLEDQTSEEGGPPYYIPMVYTGKPVVELDFSQAGLRYTLYFANLFNIYLEKTEWSHTHTPPLQTSMQLIM